ncbi:Uncharacterized membrane protein [Desulfurobacterium pacificum]|uniref:Uncharacterized membrane protein n=1 Tax=Desulfurobacterium pacificum TaxID=240166 RepID=A0ABY1NFC8_9BACT|nr:DUF2391 family protein [Desulfurobacterium pacificum]SMP07806.1 Uncharacterized membrane protein [Desulfurobacterium pacificum]
MTDQEIKKEFETIKEEIELLEKHLSNIEGSLKQEKSSFNFNDFIQELTGAIILALPFATNADIWEISKSMSWIHAVCLLIAMVFGIYMFIKYSNFGNWKIQNVAGFLPLRLITSILISMVVSALILIALGIYPAIVDNVNWFVKTIILVSIFSVIGSIGLDAAK